jgi:hypothetical protein
VLLRSELRTRGVRIVISLLGVMWGEKTNRVIFRALFGQNIVRGRVLMYERHLG